MYVTAATNNTKMNKISRKRLCDLMICNVALLATKAK